jgi:hypothetical protein
LDDINRNAYDKAHKLISIPYVLTSIVGDIPALIWLLGYGPYNFSDFVIFLLFVGCLFVTASLVYGIATNCALRRVYERQILSKEKGERDGTCVPKE